MQDSSTHIVNNTHEVTKIRSRIITQYTKDQLQLVAMHIGKSTQGEESTAPRFLYCYSTGIAHQFNMTFTSPPVSTLRGTPRFTHPSLHYPSLHYTFR